MVDFKTGTITTPIWLRDPDWEEKNPGVPETFKDMTRVIPRDADHLTELMPWGSTIRVLIAVTNFYADKTPLNNSLSYGLKFKIKMNLNVHLERNLQLQLVQCQSMLL